MNVLLLGSGGREHALAWAIAASPLLTRLICAPGNAGIAEVAECLPLDLGNHGAVIDLCRERSIDLVVVGPEAPLVAGIADDLRAAGIKVFGPSKAAAQLEGSKGFTKDLCAEAGIPTGVYARCHGRGQRQGLRREPRQAADRRQGGRARGRQGRRRRHDRSRGVRCHRCLFHRCLWSRRRRGRHRGVPRRRGSELLRALRRPNGSAAGDGPGS